MKVWINAFRMPLKSCEGEALQPPGVSASCLFISVSAHRLRCFLKQRMSFDFIENELKPGSPCGLQTLDYCRVMLHVTFDLKIKNMWLPKNENLLLNSQRANESSCSRRNKKTDTRIPNKPNLVKLGHQSPLHNPEEPGWQICLLLSLSDP